MLFANFGVIKIMLVERIQLIYKYVLGQYDKDQHYFSVLYIILLLMILMSYYPLLVASFYWIHCQFIELAKQFWKSRDQLESRFLIISLIVFGVIVVYSYGRTKLFYNPGYYDALYTTDSWAHYTTNTWVVLAAPENDIRQPIFALFSSVLSIYPYLISKVFPFLPNLYGYMMGILQVALIAIAFIAFARCLQLHGMDKVFFLLISMTSFPAILFSLLLEQYQFAMFWLALFIYFAINTKPDSSSIDSLMIASAGSLLTSWSIVLLMLSPTKIKHSIRKCIQLIIEFLFFTFICFRLSTITKAYSNINELLRFASTHGNEVQTDIEKFRQFFTFVASCFIATPSSVSHNYSPAPEMPSISLQTDLYNYYYIIGIVIFFISVVSFIMIKKEKITITAFSWIVFSFVLLAIVGWGAIEKGMVLYTLYFGWAYIMLIYKSVDKVFSNLKCVKYSIYTLIIIFQLMLNLFALYRIIDFGKLYYSN